MRGLASVLVVGALLGGAAVAVPAPAVASYEQPIRPKRQPKRLLPSQFAAVAKLHQLIGSNRHQIVLRPAGRLDLMTGARLDWTGRLSAVRPGATAQFADLYRLIAGSPHPGWLTETRPGIFLLRAALVQAPGTRLVIAAPRVRQLRLLSTRTVDQEVYLSGVSARLAVNGTAITSWTPAGGPDPRPGTRRPFVSYDQAGSVLTASRARFSYLGGDSILAYGVTWGRGVRGAAVESTFDHNFFGAYTNGAVGVLFLRSIFRDNDLYGLDPHSGSRRLIARDNLAFHNGSHGIIFSQDVVDSVVTGNRSFGNRVNGIMMDERSDRNLISNNRTWGNTGDGIVVQKSSRVVVRGNVVTGNRVGLRVTSDSLKTWLDRNRLVDNRRGVEIYLGPAPARTRTGPTVVSANTITGGRSGDGIAVNDFAGVRITANHVTGYVSGVLLTGRSPGVTVAGNRLTGAVRGIEVDPLAYGAKLNGNLVEAPAERGLVLSGRDTVSTADVVTGAVVAVDLRTDVTVTGVKIRDSRRGINLFSGTAVVSAADVAVREYGINVAPAARLRLSGSTVLARHPVVGVTRAPTNGNQLDKAPPPFQWLALAGVLFLMIAVCLHLAHRRRAPACHPRRTTAPVGVRNAW